MASDSPRAITPRTIGSRKKTWRAIAESIERETCAIWLAGALQASLEALDATARVHELLLARVERVALRADLDVQLGLGRPGLERVPTGARHRGEDVLRMDVGLHCSLKIAAACCGSTLPPETITATPRPGSTFPASTAPAAAAPAGS